MSILRVQHIRHTTTTARTHRLRPAAHLLHVAFNNRIEASEKRIDGRPVRALAGRFVGCSMLLPAGSELSGWTMGEADFLRLELEPEAVDQAAAEQDREPPVLRPWLHRDDPVLWHLACALRAELAMGEPGGMVFRDGIQGLIAHRLALLHLDRARPSRRGVLSVGQVRRVEAFVQANLQTDLSLGDLARVAGLSPFHFARAFKAALGSTPSRYVTERRLAMGCRLLEATDLAVGDIAQLAGFRSLTGFGAAFRQRWGVSPSMYRRAVRV